MDIYEEIKNKIFLLKSFDKQYEVFGANHHRYRINNILSKEEIFEIETKIGISLPEEYRNFILKIGDCEVGPHYGLVPIKKVFDKINYKNYYSTLFPHKKKWIDWDFNDITNNSMYSIVHNENYIEGIKDPEDSDGDYFDDNYKRGSIDICHEGCGHITILVISGKERGNMWGDSRCSDYGIYPLKLKNKNKERITFLEWYVDWLDSAIYDFQLIKKLISEGLTLIEIKEKFQKERLTIATTAEDIISSLADEKKPDELFGDGIYTKKYGVQGQDKWYKKVFEKLIKK